MAAMNSALPALPSSNKFKDFDAEHLKDVERKYAAAIFAMRIRLVELFQDFDQMRSGLMTESRFIRCVSASLERGKGNQLTSQELDILINEYGVPESKKVRWRDFVNKIDRVFGPMVNENGEIEYFDNSESVTVPYRRPVSPASEGRLKEIIQRLKAFGKHHGADPKSWFYDFDKNNKGWVNYNQFRRGMPQNLISPKEEDLLLARYGDNQSETVNYFKLHTDVTRKAPRNQAPPQHLVAKPKTENEEYLPIGTEEILHTNHYGTKTVPIEHIVENKVRQFVYKNRVRIIDVWKDYDRHNNGLITQTQFITGLRLARLPLELVEMHVLVNKYINADNRVNYWNFCTSIESVFTTKDLESNPLLEVVKPTREFLHHGCNNVLTPAEEAHCASILSRLQKIMKERRLLLTPFFKDFDKSLGNMGRVTKSHFSRLMYLTGLILSEDDLHILFKKFEDITEGRINYMEFIREIDPENYIGYQRREIHPAENDVSDSLVAPVPVHIAPASVKPRSLKVLVEGIQGHVVSKRIRVSEFFRDFDKLRSYSIRSEDFSRGLFNIGYTLEESEVQSLCEAYKDTSKKGFCLWMLFSSDIDKVFGEKNLESNPTYVHEQKAERSPFANTGTTLIPEEELVLAHVLQKIRSHLRFRKASIKPFFRDCDKICSGIGHVTKSQLRQCITFMECDVTEREFAVICKRYTKIVPERNPQTEFNYINDVGKNICYIPFIEELEKEFEEAPLAAQVNSIKSIPKKKILQPPTPGNAASHSAFEKLMMKIKIKAKTERIKVIDFMSDFDHLRRGKIFKNEFRRAVKVVFPDLTEQDLQILESKYEGPNDTVRYVDFSDAVEAVFTLKGLEQDPTAIPEKFDVFSNGWETDVFVNYLDPKEEEILKGVIKRMQHQVLTRKIDLIPFMEEYDYIKEGTITTNQFRSIMSHLDLNVTDREFSIICQRFASNQSITRVNYRAAAEYAKVVVKV